MGWKDAPVVSESKPKWAAAPIVEQQSKTPQPKTGLEHAADAARVFARHPFTAATGMAENALSSVTGGAGSLADAVTFADPGAHDWAYQPRTEAGREIARLGAEEGSKAGEKYDKYAGTGPLATTIKERGQEALGAVGTITALTGLRGAAGAGRVPVNARPRPPSLLRSDVPGEAGAGAVPETAAAAERPAGLAKVPEAVPTREALSKAATAAYKQADQSGVVVKPESFGALKERIVSEVQGIDPTLHPDSTAALKRIVESDGPQTLQQLETLRRIASDAEDSLKPADKRLAGKMVDQIDDYIDSLTESDVVAGDPAKGKALKEARNLYSRSKKAEELDKLVERAELSAPNFSGSGMENALRTEFRALAKNERRMRRFTPEERDAIKRVAKGGPVENALRMLGKFAPTGVVSAILSGGAGAAAGGPIGALALPAAGTAARFAATRMTMRNVARANELMRRGPKPKAATAKDALANALAEQRR